MEIIEIKIHAIDQKMRNIGQKMQFINQKHGKPSTKTMQVIDQKNAIHR